MKIRAILVNAAACAMLALATYSAVAQSVPAAKEGTWVARDFHRLCPTGYCVSHENGKTFRDGLGVRMAR